MTRDASGLRSRAEIVFARLLTEVEAPSADDVTALCARHPELAPELRRMLTELASLRTIFSRAQLVEGSSVPRLEGFECVALLGRGGMAEVWEARDLALGRLVAVKILPESSGADALAIQRFEREAQAASRVAHPAIVAVYGAREVGGRRVIVQELVPGGRTLRDEIEALRRLGRPPADHARRTAERFVVLADALAAAHAAGVVHRDLKPQNILCDAHGGLKIADFGLAHLVGGEALSRTGEFLGTLLYASPEQLDGGARRVDERSDVFSLGATLYEGLTLARPFEADSPGSLARSSAAADPELPHVRCRWVPEELARICMKALEPLPQERYASMGALRDDLRAFLEHRPVSARAPGAFRRAQKWCRRHPTSASLLGLGAAAFVAVLALYLRAERARSDASSARADALRQAAEARSESEARRGVVDFLVGLFDSGDPELPEDPRASAVVARGLEDLRTTPLEPDVQARLLTALAAVHAKLGHFAEATEVAREAVALWDELGASDHVEAVEARLLLANTLLDRSDPAGEPLFAAARERWVGRGDLPPATAVDALIGLAAYRGSYGDPDQAEALLEEAEGLARALDERPPRRLWRVQDRRVRVLVVRGEDARAEQLLRAILKEREELWGTGSLFWLEPLASLALVLQHLGRFDEAHEAYAQAATQIEASLGPDHPRALTLGNNLATLLQDEGEYAEAEALYRELIARRAEALGAEDEGLFTLRFNLAMCLARELRYGEAKVTFRELADELRARYGEDEPQAFVVEGHLARLLAAEGLHPDALALLRAVLARLPQDSPARPELERALERSAAAAARPGGG